MKKILTIILVGLSISAMGQDSVKTNKTFRFYEGTTTITPWRIINDTGFTLKQIVTKVDTIAVYAYCLIDTVNLIPEWRKLYGVWSFNNPVVIMNNIRLYDQYLMPDKKTPVKFKVIYAIEK